MISAIKLGEMKGFREWILDINTIRAYNLMRDHTVDI